jgi:glycerate kinase
VALGVSAAYSVAEEAGSVAAAMADPADRLEDLAARVARTWSR